MALRSFSFGRSRKNTWSKRPLRMISAGRRWMRFAVAATKTSPCFSCIQVRNVEKMRPSDGSPPPASRPPVIAISISSIHRSAGDSDSTLWSARWNVCSGFSVPKTRFMSRRKSGRFQSAEMAFTESDFPQPDTPMSRMPFGTENPEQTFHRALQSVESLSPALLWIDEIEMAITGGREAGGGDPSLGRIFSTFLTWMQEKQGLVFVAATANRIHLLPAEIIRKGRFDQVFFLDLPNENERKAIFNVHLKKVGADVSLFDVVFVSKATKGFVGSEIEAAVQLSLIPI